MAEGVKDILTWKDDAGEFHVIPVDLVVNHDDDRSAEVTSDPVEKGANINDHVIQNPDLLTLELAQTQTPFITPAQPGIAFSVPPGFSTQAIPLTVRKSLFSAAKSQSVAIPENQFEPGGLFAITQGIGSLLFGGPEKKFTTSGMPVQKDDATATVNVIVANEPKDRIGELHDSLIKVKQDVRFCTVTFRGRVYPDYIVTGVGWKSARGEAGLGRFSLKLQSVKIVSTDVADLPNPASLRLKPSTTMAKPAKPAGTPEELFGPKHESIGAQLTGGGASSS